MRLRLTFLAVIAAVGALFVAGPAGASAATSKPLKQTVAMTGKTSSGKAVTGTFKIDRFVKSKYTGRLIALGTYSGKIGTKHFVKRNVRVPASVAQPSGASAARICQVLNLTLGPIHLNLLGLHVDTNTIRLNITADSNGGLLGSLLCSVADLLGPNNPLTNVQLAQLLNTLLGSVLGTLG